MTKIQTSMLDLKATEKLLSPISKNKTDKTENNFLKLLEKKVAKSNVKEKSEEKKIKLKESKKSKIKKGGETVDNLDLKIELTNILQLLKTIMNQLENLKDEDIELVGFKLEEIEIDIQDVLKKLEEPQLFEEISIGENEKVIEEIYEVLKRFEDILNKTELHIDDKFVKRLEKGTEDLEEIIEPLNLEELIENDSPEKEISIQSKLGKSIETEENKEDMFVEKEDKEDENIKELDFNEEELEEVEMDIDEIDNEQIEEANVPFEIKDRIFTKDESKVFNEKIEKNEVNKEEIVRQVIDKSRTILDENKSEIRIKLKPEILGDLVLKVEVEEGVVLAKALVDNYRTKEILEANLFQLKEGLEEQGLEIKTFEVFVGNDRDFDKKKEENFERNQNRRQKRVKIKTKGIESMSSSYVENTIIKEPTMYEDRTLDLMA